MKNIISGTKCDRDNLCAAKMNKDLDCINNLAVQWLVSINATKTILMLFTTKRPRPIPPLKLGTK